MCLCRVHPAWKKLNLFSAYIGNIRSIVFEGIKRGVFGETQFDSKPDFVVEVEDHVFFVEVKGEDRVNAADVLAKKDRALRYCRVVSEWGRANGYKEWDYVFISSKQIIENSTFDMLTKRFTVDAETDILKEDD